MPRKYQDWRSWWDGLRAKTMEAGATSITTLLGTNGLDNLNIPGFVSIGMNWKTAIAQFGIHVVIAAAIYIKAKPSPDIITEETTMIHKTVTTSPAATGIPTNPNPP